MTRYLVPVAVLGLVLLFGAELAMAADLHTPSRPFSGLLELIRNNANQWHSKLQGIATRLFWLLVAIDVIVIFGPMVVRNADWGEVVGELMRFVLVIGFFASVLMYSATWSEAIINSFRQAGSVAAGTGFQLTPGDLFSLGVELAYTVSDIGTGMLNPGVALSVSLSAIMILICFAFIAALMMLTLVQSYVMTNASVLLIAFAGSKFTRDFAVAPLRYTVAVGVKLFSLHLIIGIVMASARDWQAAYQHDNTSMWVMVGLAFVTALLSKTVPEFMEGMITGAATGGGSAIGGMTAAGLAGAAAGAAVMQSVMAQGGLLNGAGKGVSDLLKSFGGGGSSGGSGGSASMSSMMGGSGGGSGPAPRASGNSPRSSGGSAGNPGPAPTASGSSGSSASSSGSSASAASPSSTAQASSGAATMAHAAAEMGIRGVGTAVSMAVPGADGAESASVGPPPVAPETPENIIRPAGDAPSAPVSEVGNGSAQPINTMSELQQALEKGNPS